MLHCFRLSSLPCELILKLAAKMESINRTAAGIPGRSGQHRGASGFEFERNYFLASIDIVLMLAYYVCVGIHFFGLNPDRRIAGTSASLRGAVERQTGVKGRKPQKATPATRRFNK
jgi:hypothetical protein